MLFELRSAEPELTEVQTWNAQANESMLKVNAELGFQPDRDWCEYGADVAELVHRLDAALRNRTSARDGRWTARTTCVDPIHPPWRLLCARAAPRRVAARHRRRAAGARRRPTAASAAPTDLFISEYVEGSSNNKAIELYNGTGAPSTWRPAATAAALLQRLDHRRAHDRPDRHGRRRRRVRLRPRRRPAPRSSPRPTRPPGPASSTATTRSCCAGGADRARLDRPGRRRPGHRVGQRADQHRRQHAAPQGRRGRPATPTRPTRSTRPPSGPASPPTPSTGWARTRRRRRPGRPAGHADLWRTAGHRRPARPATRDGDRRRPRRHDRRPGGDRGQPGARGRLDHPYRVHPRDRAGRHRDAPRSPRPPTCRPARTR